MRFYKKPAANKMAQLQILYLLISLFIVCSKCCISLNSGECSLGRTFFGGRLVLTGGDELGTAGLNKQFIFVTPFGVNSYDFKSLRGFGRGRVWIGKRNCLGNDPQSQDFCPLAGARPCLDTTVPCFSEPPSYIQPYPLQFSNVTEDSITVSWPAWNETTDLGVGPVTQYKLQHREAGGIFNDTLLDAQTISHRFDGLKNGTTYQFRIILIRELPYIESQPSSIQNETTTSQDPPRYIQDNPLKFSDVTDNSITVTWPAWDKTTGKGRGPVTEYRLQFREQGEDTWKNVTPNDAALSYRFVELKEGTTYEFRIILHSSTDPPLTGPPSSIQTNATLCGDLGDLNLVLDTSSVTGIAGKARIDATWDIRHLPSLCNISQQSITIHQLDRDDCPLATSVVSNTSSVSNDCRQYTFQGLKADWNFNITLQVTNPSGVYTSSKVQRTLETIPSSPPSNVKVIKRRKLGFAGFAWEEPPCLDRHGKIVKYGYYITGPGRQSPEYYIKKKYLFFKENVSGFAFKVRAYTSKGPGPYSESLDI